MSIPKLEKSGNGTYYVHWSDRGRSKRVSTRTTDVAAAKAFLSTWLKLEADPKTVGSTATVAALWAVYEEKHLTSVASPATASFSWANLEQHFGELRLDEIDQDVVDAYRRARIDGTIGKPSKPSTVRRELAALRACLNWCAGPRRKLVTVAELPAFDLPEDSAPRDRWLREDEAKKLFAATTGRLNLFLHLALYTAARKQALYDLTWDRVDFETNVIVLDVPGRRTTKKRRATVPISTELREVLLAAHEKRTTDLVLTNKAEVWAGVQSAVRRAGLAPAVKVASGRKPSATGVSPHTLRHTAATWMARRGVPLWIIAKILGNSLVTIEKVYAKHAPEDLRAAINMIGGK